MYSEPVICIICVSRSWSVRKTKQTQIFGFTYATTYFMLPSKSGRDPSWSPGACLQLWFRKLLQNSHQLWLVLGDATAGEGCSALKKIKSLSCADPRCNTVKFAGSLIFQGLTKWINLFRGARLRSSANKICLGIESLQWCLLKQ